MHAIIRQRHVRIGQPPEPTRMPVGPQQHRHRRIEPPKLHPLSPPFNLRRLQFLQLNPIKLQIIIVQSLLALLQRLRPLAIAAFIPRPVLEVGRRERPQENDAVEALQPVDRPERRLERPPVAEIGREVFDFETVPGQNWAAHNPPASTAISRTRCPADQISYNSDAPGLPSRTSSSNINIEMVMMGLERLVVSLKTKLRRSVKTKNNSSYDKIEKSDSMRVEIRSRKAQKLIQETLKIADSPHTKSFPF
nr:hypothetical protein CDL15_Pgr020424 [Ipomoea batatas]